MLNDKTNEIRYLLPASLEKPLNKESPLQRVPSIFQDRTLKAISMLRYQSYDEKGRYTEFTSIEQYAVPNSTFCDYALNITNDSSCEKKFRNRIKLVTCNTIR